MKIEIKYIKHRPPIVIIGGIDITNIVKKVTFEHTLDEPIIKIELLGIDLEIKGVIE